MTEGRCVQIKGDGRIIGRERVQLLLNDIYHTKQSVGTESLSVCQHSNTVKSTIENAVAINGEKMFHMR